MKNKARTRKKRRQAKAVLKHGRSAAPQAYRKKWQDRHDVLKAAEVAAHQGGTEVTIETLRAEVDQEMELEAGE